MQGIIDQITKELKPLTDWIAANNTNPFLWVGLFLGGLFLFGLTFSALQKEK